MAKQWVFVLCLLAYLCLGTHAGLLVRERGLALVDADNVGQHTLNDASQYPRNFGSKELSKRDVSIAQDLSQVDRDVIDRVIEEKVKSILAETPPEHSRMISQLSEVDEPQCGIPPMSLDSWRAANTTAFLESALKEMEHVKSQNFTKANGIDYSHLGTVCLSIC